MGKGDRKTKKGKIAMGSYGNTRPKKSTSGTGAVLEKKKVERREDVAEDAKQVRAEKRKKS